ncbi:MAG: hypothetical protein QF741_01410 [Candidatus Peribacteraceae bacterium]|jgi:hypothetical protein|nr:hypothetical protein [Spirochaetales bacterium]MDP7247262.1 hypothetical protein [Candidatus Peribacteraceae bacterium]MDP7453994.1 hypothetical protein [Candidatus Peribacteraceae bacterium]MDP7646358.1 hypothetical protein [Candidatus Peribacteraceae bacterium]|tara:strand:- start:980 stop:1210 length:231 start_codon:yes stop_codon:yes gene_type:complete
MGRGLSNGARELPAFTVPHAEYANFPNRPMPLSEFAPVRQVTDEQYERIVRMMASAERANDGNILKSGHRLQGTAA